MNFMASTPNAFVMEHDKTLNPLREAMLVEPLVYENGYVKLTQDLPGIGAQLTDETIRRFPYDDSDAVDKGDFVPMF